MHGIIHHSRRCVIYFDGIRFTNENCPSPPGESLPHMVDSLRDTICSLGAKHYLLLIASYYEYAKESLMPDYSKYLEGYRDAQAYDVEEGDYDADYPLTEQLAR